MTEEAHNIDPRIAEHAPHIAALAEKHLLLINMIERMFGATEYFRDADYYEARGYLAALMWTDAIPAGPGYVDHYMEPLRVLQKLAKKDVEQQP